MAGSMERRRVELKGSGVQWVELRGVECIRVDQEVRERRKMECNEAA
jgi:hypothetical protein